VPIAEPVIADPVVADPVVATVAGRQIRLARLEQRIADLRRGPRGRHMPPDDGSGPPNLRRWVVQELVTEAVLAHEVEAHGIEPRAAASGEALSPASIARLVELVTADVTVAEADVRAYYERNQDLYRQLEARRIRHVVVADEATADQAVRSLREGQAAGTEVDIHRGELVGALEDAVFGAGLATGAVVGPLLVDGRWHVARLEGTIPGSVVPYEEARPSIEAELLVAARRRAFDEWLEQRRQALAVIEPDFEHPAHPMHGVPSHRH
jgi:hypothetical protein